MGFIFGLLKRLIKWTLYLALFAVLIVVIPNLPPYSKFTTIELEPGLPRTGALAPNEALNNAQKLYKEKLLGPEAFQIHNNEVYTSLASGEIVKLSPGGHVTFVTKIGFPCTGSFEEEKCGRPLGFQIDAKQNKLYVSDAYHGIWKVDLGTDKKQLLVSPRVEIEGRTPRLFNSIELASNGDFYWTDSSSEFPLKDGAFSSLADPTGRLFYYNAAKNSSKVLLDGLWFANGLALSPDRQFVVVAETSHFRLLKYYVAGPKQGQSEVFVAGLPGVPDNVRVLPDGSGVLVGLYVVYDEQNPLLMRNLAAMPALRKLVARAARLAEMPFEFLNTQFPHIVFQTVVRHIGSFESMSDLLPPLCGLAHIDWNGNVVATYYNTDKSLRSISDGIVYNDMLYLGSPNTHDFVGAVPAPEGLKRAFISKHPEPIKVEPKVAPKPTQQEQVKPKVEVKREAPKPVPVNTTPKPAPKQETPTVAPKQETPKVAPKQETPKVAPKQEAPKPAPKQDAPKPAPVKETPKPAQKQTPPPPTPKPADVPKPVTQKPIEKPKAEPAKPKQEATTSTPVPIKDSNTDGNKPTPNVAKNPHVKDDSYKRPPGKPVPKEIPIVEEIPADTMQPKPKPMKVITKQGEAELPVN